MKRKRGICIALILIASIYRLFSQDEELIRKEYDSSFDNFADLAKNKISESKYDNISRLLDFRRLILWVALKDDKFYSLQYGKNYGVYISIVPVDHEKTKKMLSTFQTESYGTFSVILIQPMKVSPTWKSIFLVHELSHLKDYYQNKFGAELDHKEYLINEMNAYMVEMDAANIISNEKFEEYLQRKISEWNPSSISEIMQMFSELSENEIFELRNTITNEPAESISESGLRGGFYLIAFCLEAMKMGLITEENICNFINSF